MLIATLLLVAQSLLVGCGTSAVVTSDYRLAQGEKVKLQLSTPPAASEEGVTIFRERLRAQLVGKGLLADPNDASGKTLEVTVNNYSMRHGAARAMVGIMAGSDNIQSTVKVKDGTGKALSEFTVESKNSTAWGTSRGLIEEHADEIVATLSGTKR
jgi:hypothetical protein